jgi:hypothetical protein
MGLNEKDDFPTDNTVQTTKATAQMTLMKSAAARKADGRSGHLRPDICALLTWPNACSRWRLHI